MLPPPFHHHVLYLYAMEEKIDRKTYGQLVTQEITSLYGIGGFIIVTQSPSLESTLSHLNPVHSLRHTSLKFLLISCHVTDPDCSIFVFPTKILM